MKYLRKSCHTYLLQSLKRDPIPQPIDIPNHSEELNTIAGALVDQCRSQASSKAKRKTLLVLGGLLKRDQLKWDVIRFMCVEAI